VRLLENPTVCRKAAKVVQNVPANQQWDFVMALGKAKTINDLSPQYRAWLNNGYSEPKSDNVSKSLEQALSHVKIEWIEE